MASAVALGINGSFNIGQDVSVTLQHLESGVVIPVDLLGLMTEFDASQEDSVIKVVPITDGGVPYLNNVYYGWSGHMSFARYNGNLTGILATMEYNFYNFSQLSHWNILAQVVNRDGTIDQYIFNNGVLSRGTAGNFRADKEVDMRVDFQAQSMVITSGTGALLPLL